VPYVAQVASVDQVDLDRDLITRAYALWNAGDVATLAEGHWSDGIEWHDPEGLADGGIFVGREAVIARVVELGVKAGLPDVSGVEITPVGSDYVVELDFVLRAGAANASELPLDEVPYVHLLTLEQGRVTRIRTFTDAESAFAAAAEQRR
jgi:ketosteroid isomerase-like protein